MQSAIASYRAGDFQAALEELQVLAQQNDPFAQHALGLMYAEGAGTPRDRIKAAKWYAKAAELGLAQSQHNLAVSYYTGIGVSPDYAMAAAWYRKAAEQGDSRAQNNLGYMYDTGQGIELDSEQAVYWYRVGRTSPYYPVDGESAVVPRLESKGTPKRPDVDQNFGPLPALIR